MKASEVKVLELKGWKALRAFNAFHTLLLGLKMLPAYLGEKYEDFYAAMAEKSDDEKEKMIREAMAFVALEREEVEAVCSFAATPHGVPLTPAMVAKLSGEDLFEVMVAVLMEIGRIKITLVSDSEKKNLKTSA